MTKSSAIMIVVSLLQTAPLFAQDEAVPLPNRMLPNEYETVGGHALGFANGGAVAQGGLAAVRLNPAMLPLEKTYAVGGGYNWPSVGREFYQAGVVDSKSSPISAGFIYSGFTGNYYKQEINERTADSPVNRRFCLGIGQAVKKIALGINVQYLEANVLKPNEDDPSVMDEETERGTGVGIGMAGLLSENLRFGASVENLGNKKIAEYAPRTYRAGMAYLFGQAHLTAHLDLRQRDRVSRYEKININDEKLGLTLDDAEKYEEENEDYEAPERLAIASLSIRVYDVVRVLGGYGQSLGGPDRKILAGGLALVSNNFSLSYTAERPYLEAVEAQQALNLTFAVNL